MINRRQTMAQTKTEEASRMAHTIKTIFEDIRHIAEEYLAEDIEQYRNPDVAMDKINGLIDKYNNL
jgi:hypothetical protein